MSRAMETTSVAAGEQVNQPRTPWHMHVRRALLLAYCIWLVAFPPFASAGFLNAQWDVPTTNADGSALNDLLGYRVYSGTTSPTCSGSGYVSVAAPMPNPGPGQTFPVTLTNLTSGTTYFVRVSAVDISGNESPCTPAAAGVARTDLGVTPASLGFGDVNVGSTATLDLTVQNLGVVSLTGTASVAAPFSIVSGASLSINPGASQVVRVQFAPTGAQTYAGNVTITTSGDDATRGVSGTGVGATPTTVQFSQATATVAEGGTATITVTRTGGTAAGVTVQYATGGGNATAGADYTATSGTLTFGAGQMSRTFTVTTLGDTLAEGTETIGLTLSNPQGATLGTPGTATLSITDDDVAGVVQFAAASYTVAEGAGSVTVNVTRTGTASGVTVNYATANGSASAGSDYSSRSGALTFNAGVTTLPITVPVLQDSSPEPSEAFTVTLSGASGGATLGATTVTTVTITDDEPTLRFGSATYSVAEPAGTATITVNRVGSTAGQVTVGYATTTSGNAVAGSDYTPVSGTLTIPVGQAGGSFTVPVLDDSVADGSRTVGLALSSPGGAVLGSPSTATLTITDSDAAGSIQFAAAAYTVDEGAGSVTVNVARTGGLAGGITVSYTTADGSASAGSDYTMQSGTLSFAAGVTTLPIVIPILQDTVVEGAQTFTVSLGTPTGGATRGTPAVTTVTINDDETSMNVRFSAATYTASEAAGQATITVTRAGGTGAVTVEYATTSGGNAVPGTDFTPVSGTLSFAARQSSRTFTVPVLNDDVVDGPRTVALALSNPVGALLGGPSTATLTLTDDDVAGSIQFSAAQYWVDEGGGTVNVTVTRTGGTAAGAGATYGISGGTAAAGSDFLVGGLGTVTFGRGVTSMTIPITLTGDALLEGTETIELTLSNPLGGASLGTNRQATVMIEEAAFQFAPAVYTVTEGGSATVTVTRTGPVTRAATVDFSTGDGTAVAGADYNVSAGTLSFAAGVRSRTFTVSTLTDTAQETAETVLLTLRNPSPGAILGPQRTALLTINDNDFGGRIYFSPASHVVAENRGSLNVPVVRSGGIASGVTVAYTVIGGTAQGAGVDYTLISGTLTFAAGQTTATIPVNLTDDGVVEPDETIILELSAPTGGATLGTPSTATITITDNDRSSTVQLGAATYSVVEGLGAATITLTRTGTTTTPVSVVLATSNGTATAGVDYNTVTMTVDFAAGVTSRMITVPIIPNTAVDGTRTVNLTLSSVTAPAALGARSTAVLSILDDDSVLALGASSYTATEGGAVSVTVLRTGSLVGTVSVGYALTGISATGTFDFATSSGRLTFGPGVMSQTVSVRTLVDPSVEGDETIQVALSAPQGQATLGTPATALVTVVDAPPVVRFGAAAYTVTEGTATATITVTRTGQTAGTVTVGYATIGGTATGGGVDYTFTPGTLTFTPGTTSRSFTVAIANDTTPEVPETVIFQLTGASGAVIGTPGTTTLTIQDNEPSLRFAAATYSVSEATATATITVLRSGSTTVPVTVNYARIGGTATGGGTDYTFTPGTLSFGPGVSSRTFTLAITNDLVAEGPETIVFELSGATGATVGTPATTTLTILDDEPQVRFSSAAYSVTEGTPSVTVTVQRTGPTVGTVMVDYGVTGGTASGSQDYTVGGTGTLTFAPGVTAQSFTVAITDDTVVESLETLVLGLGNPVNATLGTPATTTISTTSNDAGGRVQFASPIFTQDEAGNATITLTRTSGLASAVMVDVTTTDGSAVAGTHYAMVATTLTFDAGQSIATVTVPLIDNGADGAARWLSLTLSAPLGGVTLGTPSTAVLWIADND